MCESGYLQATPMARNRGFPYTVCALLAYDRQEERPKNMTKDEQV